MQTNNFISSEHDSLFKENIGKLLSDIGEDIIIYERAGSVTTCTWCIRNPITGRSSGKPQVGKDWTTHPNYSVPTVCPECNNLGSTTSNTQTTINNVIVEDVSGMQIERGKYGFFPAGTKKLTGVLSDVLSDSSDTTSPTKFQIAKKIVVQGKDHRLLSLQRTGIKDRYLYVALIQRADVMDLPT